MPSRAEARLRQELAAARHTIIEQILNPIAKEIETKQVDEWQFPTRRQIGDALKPLREVIRRGGPIVDTNGDVWTQMQRTENEKGKIVLVNTLHTSFEVRQEDGSLSVYEIGLRQKTMPRLRRPIETLAVTKVTSNPPPSAEVSLLGSVTAIGIEPDGIYTLEVWRERTEEKDEPTAKFTVGPNGKVKN